MAKGSVRLGSITKAEAGFDLTRWHHPLCFIKEHFKGDITTLDMITGFKSLKTADQEDLKKLAADLENTPTEMAPKRLKTEKDGAGISDEAPTFVINFSPSHLTRKYKDAELPEGWKAFSTVIINETDDTLAKDKIAGFDFDGCLVKTSVQRHGADAWSLLYPSIPKKMQEYHNAGYKLVIFTNESNIDRWKNSRQKAVDSKIGRLKGFMKLVDAPMQVFISCGKEGTDLYRKPKHGMWLLLERHFNNGVLIDKTRSFYVGDAAGRPNDHSDADLGFAKAAGLEFLVPEDVFVEKLKIPCLSLKKASKMQSLVKYLSFGYGHAYLGYQPDQGHRECEERNF
ncbi:hypothetical protein GOP47_0000510 [Adiantum capillus-veneris]|uniref:PARP-type domain-containing protein n=1 Tax=Adiantum capillus-veneris TaxID=13818 RepID=A0A9D4ZSD9_ADICA|nr:hypothetical protein GOP47_0000510 [Adiantum capillus-veneris]